jgi:hypothetical protein
MVWLIVALVTWPLLALLVGMFLGRGIAAAESNQPKLSLSYWLRREAPRDSALQPADEETTTRI